VDHTSGCDTIDGVVLEVSRSGSGRPLFLLHGGEGVRPDAGFIASLAADFDVIAPSHPGFDLSPRPRWCDSVEDLAYHYLRWIEALDLQDVTLVGLQFGGWIAAEMATRAARDRFRKLVLIDPLGIKVGGREDRDITDVFATPHERLDELVYHGPRFRDYVSAEQSVDTALWLARNEEALAHYGWQPYMHNPKLRRRLSAVETDTLVLWGEHDGIADLAYGRAYAASIPNAEFAIVPGVGHRPQVEAAADVASRVKTFAETGERHSRNTCSEGQL
jgi:pimeloyl-ACP methyl ester carboxylesterase